MECPLCHNDKSYLEFQRRDGDYYRCRNCDFVFEDPDLRLALDEEKSRYDLHHNDPDDPDYREFLRPVVQVIQNERQRSAKGMDFGCGPGPALGKMLQERGFDITLYDPLYFNNPQALDRKYDFITLTEVIEHFFHPDQEFEKLKNLMNFNSILVVMTSILYPDMDFLEWHYPSDPTHVSFYSQECMEWIADRWGWKVEFPANNLTLFKN